MFEVGAGGLGARRGDLVRTAPVLRGQGHHQAALLESGQRTVERAGAERHAGDLLDVLDQGVAMLGTARQARQDEDARLGEPSLHARPYYVARYIARRNSRAGGAVRKPGGVPVALLLVEEFG